MITHKIFPILSCVISCFVGSNSLMAEAKILARFTDGDGASAPDAFPGASGQGWQDGWRPIPINYQDKFSVEVSKENPFPDASHYLKVRTKGNQMAFALSRLINPESINTAKPHVITFKVRLDSAEAASGQFGFRIQGKQESVSTYAPSTSIWFLAVQNGRWFVVGKDAGKAVWSGSPFRITPETIYSCEVRVNPETGTYTAKLSDGNQEHNFPEMKSFFPEAAMGGNEISFAGGFLAKPGLGSYGWSLADVQITGSK